MNIVIIESPYAGNIEANLTYVRECMADCLARGEAPFASHALYTQPGVLDDTIPAERELGIQAGFAFRAVSDLTAFYIDRGISSGMRLGHRDALDKGHRLELRSIHGALSLTDMHRALEALTNG